VQELASATASGLDVPADTRVEVERWLSERILALRLTDRDYWREIIAELRELRRTGQLMPLGTPVCLPR